MSLVDKPIHNSGAWLKQRTDAELEEILDGSFPDAPAYQGADRELARRAADRSERRQLFWIRLTFATGVLLGLAGIAATLLA